MRLPALGYINKFVEIPKAFYSFDNKPFTNCIICNNYLLEDGTQYLIERAIKKLDVIFEYAICLECADEMRLSLSADSINKIESYFNNHVDLFDRQNQLANHDEMRAEEWISHCVIKGTHVHDAGEYQIVAHCDGKDLLFSHMPYMISKPAMEEMSDLLSEKTKDELDRFIDDHFGLPPVWKKALKEDGILV